MIDYIKYLCLFDSYNQVMNVKFLVVLGHPKPPPRNAASTLDTTLTACGCPSSTLRPSSHLV
jgi:hypothetical protein